MRKIKSVDVRQVKARTMSTNLSKTYKQSLQAVTNYFFFENVKQHQILSSELEIDIVLICLNTCRYVLLWIILLCVYASI
ncbi:hypothetical protein NIES4103_64900 [Nostoc sp. NIES-4103]|nr:hypothetical protein NIES4103_64900 [Nostoc sp. NIES-4103]